MSRLWAILLASVLLLSLVTSTYAQEDDVEEKDDEVEPMDEAPGVLDEEGDGIYTSCIFPNFVERRIPAGETVESLVGFDNRGDSPYYVEFMRGYLTSPMDFAFFVQNFSGSLYNTTVAGTEEASLLYRFKPDVSIDPREYGLYIEVYYKNEDNETYLSVVYNSTIEITDPLTSLDAKTVFAYLLMVAVFAGVIFLIFRWLTKGKGGRGGARASKSYTAASTAQPEMGTGDVDLSFIPKEHRAMMGSGKKKASPQRGSSPSKGSSPTKKKR